MLEKLLPPPASVAEARDDDAAPALFPEEHSVIEHAVAGRRREFRTVRGCARTALARLGIAPVPILPGVRGAPRWPDGVVGSMTHCLGYRAAAVAAAGDLAAIGLDAEPNRPLRGTDVLEAVALPAERAAVAALGRAHPEVCWDRLLFSAKESVYKTWYPLTRRPLDFDQATITFDPLAGTFTARLLVRGPVLTGAELRFLHGGWLCADGLLLTAIALPAPAPVPVPVQGAAARAAADRPAPAGEGGRRS